MAWRFLKHFVVDPSDYFGPCSSTHMQGPVALRINDSVRVYFAARGSSGKSFPAYIDLNSDLTHITGASTGSIMPHGPLGTFDDDGNMPACALVVGSETWLYYSGWNRRVTAPYHNTIGLARSSDGGASFDRAFDGPVLDRGPFDPLMCVTPFVLRTEHEWRMWYVSGRSWIEKDERLEPTYDIRSATSKDGVNWTRDGKRMIPLRHAEEAIARPTVLQHDGRYHMWYSYRDSIDFRNGSGSYQIGYAISRNGVDWVRADELGGGLRSGLAWDRRMQCYPYVISMNDRFFMFYNGDGFGQTGIGVAVWDGELPRL